MAFSLQSLSDGVRLLGQIDPTWQVFGASEHQYRFAPPLASGELAALEAQVGALPAAYRALLLEIGARGAGPYYGLLAPAPPPDFTQEAEADPRRPFGGDGHPLDGTLLLAQQGCGGRSLLVIAGPHAGEVWSDWTMEHGPLEREATSLMAWFSAWIERALVEWFVGNAARIAIDGPRDPAELEAISMGFEAVAREATRDPEAARALGYLHARERRWDDARAAFEHAAKLRAEATDPIGDLAAPVFQLDLARMFYVMEAYDQCVLAAERGLALEQMWHHTRDLLRSVLEDAFTALGEHDKALAVLEARAAEQTFGFELHHRLARVRMSRGDLAGAGAALERAANIPQILGREASLDERLAASFEPIIAELHGAKRAHDGAALEALVEKIRTAN